MALHVVDHPLVRHKLGLLRRESTSTSEFRMVAKEIGRLLTYEATRELQTETKSVQGWAGPGQGGLHFRQKSDHCPHTARRLGLMDGVLDMVPGAKISVVGLYRNEETLEPVEYYVKLAKSMDKRIALILDPMLATGGSMVATIDLLKRQKCPCIRALTLVCAPEGVKRVLDAYPDVEIYTASLDSHLNEKGYIIPGLGDARRQNFWHKIVPAGEKPGHSEHSSRTSRRGVRKGSDVRFLCVWFTGLPPEAGVSCG